MKRWSKKSIFLLTLSKKGKLSLDRAQAIKNKIETKHGINKNRLFEEGVGPLAPVASNKTEEGKQKNRRVELVLK